MNMFFLTCIFLVLRANFSSGQTNCVWEWIQPPTSANFVRSVGAPGDIIVSVTDVPGDGLQVKWTQNGLEVAKLEYNAGTSSYDTITSYAGGSARATRAGGKSQYTLSTTAFPEIDAEEIVVESESCSTGSHQSPKLTLDARYCGISNFEPTASQLNGSSTCGYNCVVSFTCNSSYVQENFTAACTESAEWSSSEPTCRLPCNNTFFNDVAAPADNDIVGAGQSKMFNCTCPQGEGFNRNCGPDGSWTNETTPCTKACSADAITRGTPVGNQLLCGRENHAFICNSELVCKNTTFMLQCNANGTWNSTADNCSKGCSADSPLGGGAIAGIAIASFVVLGGAGTGIYFLARPAPNPPALDPDSTVPDSNRKLKPNNNPGNGNEGGTSGGGAGEAPV